MNALKNLEHVLEDAVSNGVAPGLVALVSSGQKGGDRLVCSVGKHSYYQGASEVSPSTIYDLASLTKILSTTVLCATAVDEGKLSLDECPWPYWPKVSVKQVLAHRAGLLWWDSFYERVAPESCATPRGRAALLNDLLCTKPAAAPEESTVYSDVGFIALGALIEERYGRKLDALFAAQDLYGEHSMRFVDVANEGHHPQLDRVAPTEQCAFRGRVVHGQVHDLNAYAMGGIAGHAGLFGTITDLEIAGRALLNPKGSLQDFIMHTGERALGFDRPTPKGTTGDVMSDHAFGHLGFTGTSLWMDPMAPAKGGAIYALLSNRVHPDVEDKSAMKALRIRFHQCAHEWLKSS